ncbi:uncharacterized protein LOC132053101 isoform X2 [Lycium ferocissimum]|uniref:uncharacterized protein LOC132053101 isoform X2 n=1 Tax=Lycium ferocissimum TaxID=112874 RepID=UPI0028149C1F|nr:uncharacterized protein LOC132053101 isoform X2 [Lycium ferocissimum]
MFRFLKEVVGGSGTGLKDLPYNISGRRLGLGQGIEATGGSFQLAYGGPSGKKGTPDGLRIEVALYRRSSKTDDGTPVSIFALTGSNANDGHLAAGRNGVKRLRTVRHPNILSFLYSTEAETFDGSTTKVTIYIVTEPVMPLSEKLKELGLKGTQRDEYYAWGLHRIAKAVSFLNNDCKLVHGNVCLASVVVTQTVDWKLHAFDVLSEFDGNNESFVGPMLQYDWLIGAQYKPTELLKSDWTSIRKSPPWAIDSWGLGCLIYELFSCTKLSKTEEVHNTASIPKSLLPDYQRLLSATPACRLNSSKLLENGEYFQNKLLETIQFMEILNLKDSVEKDIFFRYISVQCDLCLKSKQIKQCLLQLLPLLASALEFGSAAAPALTALLKMGSWLSNEEFSLKVLPTIVKLFGSNDRAIRVSLLQNIDQYGESLSSQIVDEQVYAHVATGFSDTSAFLRELTLRSMLVLAPKLSHRTISGSLLKYLSKLQVDEEPEIRTNTTILLGNIASYLNEGTRKRVQINAFTVRALRDTYPLARGAGVKALSATSSYYDVTEIATRILPNIVVLTIDPDSDVRSEAFQAVDQFLQIVKEHHDKPSTGDTSTTSMGSSSIPGNAGLLGWAMSSLTLKGGKSPEQSSNTPVISSVLLTSAVSGASSIADSSSITPVHISSGGADVADHPVPVSPTSTDGWGELENGIHEGHGSDKDGWDDIEEPKPSPSPENIQAAQRRSVSQPKPQGTGLRGKTTPKMSKYDDEDLRGSVAVPAPRATSQPSSSRANRKVDDNNPWAAISAPAPSAKPLNVKRSGALDDNDPWAAIAAPVPTTTSRPSIGRGRGTKPAAPRLGAQRVNRTSSGM